MKTRTAILAGFAVCVAAVWGCRTGEARRDGAEVESSISQPLEAAETRFERYKSDHVIPPDGFIDAPSAFRRKLRQKGEALDEVYRAYVPLFESQSVSESTAAALRIGQLYLNMGCELARIQPPGHVADPEERRHFVADAKRRVEPVVEKARRFLREAAQRGARPWAGKAERWLKGWRRAESDRVDVLAICRATRDAWRWEVRPAAQKFRRACEDGQIRACVRLGRFLGGEEGRSYLKKACRAGASDGCAELAESHLKAGRPGRARDFYQAACQRRLAWACTARELVVDPGRAASNREACRAGNPRACLKRATLLSDASRKGAASSEEAGGGGARRGLLAVCPLDQLPKMPAETQAKSGCLSGRATACLAHASALLRSGATVLEDGAATPVPTPSDGPSSEEPPAVSLERLKADCESGEGWACLDWARRREADEKSADAQWRAACEAGEKAGCFALGRQQVAAGDRKDGLASMERACRLGHAEACERVGRALINGEGLPEHQACGLAYLWQNCRADSIEGCRSLDALGASDPEK